MEPGGRRGESKWGEFYILVFEIFGALFLHSIMVIFSYILQEEIPKYRSPAKVEGRHPTPITPKMIQHMFGNLKITNLSK